MADLTEAQKAAVETVDKSLCVSAGAGTGKTRVLVERFIHLIERKLAGPCEILAITFTDKAAQEMKARIARALRERGLEPERRELENAYIGTIHAFCARILREHPLEAGLDPGFRVLEEDEAELLQESVLDALMEARFQEPGVFDLLRTYSEKALRDSVKEVYAQARRYAAPFAEQLQKKPALHTNEVKQKALQALGAVQSFEGRQEAAREAEEFIRDFRPDGWERIEALKAVGKTFRKQGKAKEAVSEFQDCLQAWVGLEAERMAEAARETFCGLLLDFEARYARSKRESAALDFSDLERDALALLSGPGAHSAALRSLYRDRFKFVMVDEFQDTSPLQNELISILAREENLFVVGDWKQSIYGFRGTDVALFFQKEAEFQKSAKGACIALVENFRSRPELLDFVNRTFGALWKSAGGPFDPLRAAKRFPSPSGPSVEFLTIERSEGDSADEARMKEARVVAREIRRHVDSGAYQFRDFAVLFRATTDIYFYEHELRSLSIPYHVVSGRGFYRQPEIRDLMSALELLENPHFDVPLAAALRSPLVQISDDALFWLAHYAKSKGTKTPLYTAFVDFENIQEIAAEDREKLAAFKELFDLLLGEKEKWSVSECLELILTRTRYDLYVLGLAQGNRHYANLRKLLEIAREAEYRSPIHLGDFVRYVKGLETQEVRESEAQVEASEGNVVKLMTIHKAKGLEFRAVVLPDLHRKEETRAGRFLLDPALGLGLSVWNNLARDFERTWTYDQIKERIQAQEEEESKRLLYVAATRAQDYLILSGAGNDRERKDSRKSRNWHDWIDACGGPSDETFVRRPAEAVFELGGRKRSALIHHKKIREAVENLREIRLREPDEAEQIVKALAPVPPVYFKRIDLPVTAYAVFQKDPEQYRATYELGTLAEERRVMKIFPEKAEEWAVEEDEGTVSAAEFGTVVHKVLEHLVSSPESAQKRLPALLARFSEGLDPQVQGELGALAKRFLNSETFRDVSRAGVRKPEIPFVLKLRSGIVQGTLDLLYRSGKGDWIILDYKTSQLRTRGARAELGLQYQPQMMLYALACHELLKLPAKRAVLYFVRTDETFEFDLKGIDYPAMRAHFESVQKKIIAECKAWSATQWAIDSGE